MSSVKVRSTRINVELINAGRFIQATAAEGHGYQDRGATGNRHCTLRLDATGRILVCDFRGMAVARLDPDPKSERQQTVFGQIRRDLAAGLDWEITNVNRGSDAHSVNVRPGPRPQPVQQSMFPVP